jgi:hypothetical protein
VFNASMFKAGLIENSERLMKGFKSINFILQEEAVVRFARNFAHLMRGMVNGNSLLTLIREAQPFENNIVIL